MEKLNYSIGSGLSHQALIVAGELLLENANRDMNVLSSEGLTTNLLDQFTTKLTALIDNKSTHGTYVADRKESTQLVKVKSVEVISIIERLRAQVRLIYSKKTGRNSAIFSKGLSNLNPEQLIKIAEETIVILQENAEEVAIYGVTTEKVAQFETLVGEFFELHKTQSLKTKNLNNYTEDRIELRSEVYQLLDYISGIGRAYWKRNKKSRYDDYVIRKMKAPPKTASNQTTTEEVATTATSF